MPLTPQFDNNLVLSFHLWTENRIQFLGGGYTTLTTPLYCVPDPTLPSGYLSYSSPWQGWVYDSGVTGATIINSVSGGSTVYTRASGFLFDYLHGRAIVPPSYGTGLVLTGTASIAAVNVYQPIETEDQLLTQTKFFRNPWYQGAPTGGLPPNTYSTPSVFINTLHSDSQAFTFGGLDDTPTIMSLLLVMESNFQLNAMLSLFRDAAFKYFPLLSLANEPLNLQGDLLSGYNYTTYTQQYGTPGNLVYIASVKTAKVSDKVKMNPAYFVGLVDLECRYVRQTS